MESVMNATRTSRRWCTCRALALASLSCAAVLLCGPCGMTKAATWTSQATPRASIRHGDLAGVSCTAARSCIAVGSSFEDDPSVQAPLIERWNGVAWRVQVTTAKRTLDGELLDVSCSSGIACTAVGDFESKKGITLPVAERWNGSSWRIQPVPSPHSYGSADEAILDAVSCTSRMSCTAVGLDTDLNQPLVERWNGSKWSIQRAPSPSVDGAALYSISCSSQRSCTAVGVFLNQRGCDAPLVERLHGSAWSIEPSALLPNCGSPNDSSFDGVACVRAIGCTAVGYYDVADRGYDFPLVEQAPAGSWSIQSTSPLAHLVDPWGGGAFLNDVACTSTAACIAVGGAGSDIKRVPLVERRTGTQWKPQVIRGVRDGALFAVSCTSESTCTAVGENDSQGPGSDVPLVERLSPAHQRSGSADVKMEPAVSSGRRPVAKRSS